MSVSQGYDRLAAANPIPDPDRYVVEEFDVAPIRDVEEIFEAGRSIAPAPSARSRPVVAVAAFLTALLVGVVALVVVGNGDRAPVGDDPVAVVTAYFDRWNEGDVDGALELLDPDATINVGFNSRAELRGLMEYATAWGYPMDATCRATERAGSVSCEWEWTAESVAALGLDGPNQRRFQVTDGLITSLVTPSYGAHEGAVSGYAKSADPDGFATACDPGGAISVSAYDFAFDAECGRFLADLEAGFIEQLRAES
jgi:hypothetical protein